MTSFTPNFGLPYPSPTDAPCDFASQWCDFTGSIDAIFNIWQSGIDRTVPVIPIAKLLLTSQATVPNAASIPFDTVIIDTSAMSDLDADPYTLTIPRTGRYTITSYIRKFSSGVANSEITTTVTATLGGIFLSGINTRGETLDQLPATYFIPAYNCVLSLAAGTKLNLTFSVGAVVNVIIEQASLSVAWHSDTEVP